MLRAISPIDGRYASKTKELQDYFSEFALIKYRVWVEIQYFKALCQVPLPQLSHFPKDKMAALDQIVADFSDVDAQKIKDIEKVTNHDVKRWNTLSRKNLINWACRNSRNSFILH